MGVEMSRCLCLTIVSMLGLMAAGCETLSLKEFTPADGSAKSAFVDIKQRAVLVGRPNGAASKSADLVFCAEPSPDAISSLASEFAADAKYKDALAATLGFSQQEAASFVGLRTQTIQLLRDGMFRLCEGYLGGALSPSDFAWLSRRYQRNMVALLTIEQLTRVAQIPTIGQVGQGMASASRSAAAIQGDLEELDKDLARLKDEKTKIEAEKAEADKLTDGDEKTKTLKEIKGRLNNNAAATKRVEELRSALFEGLETARGVLVNGSTTVQVLANNADTRGQVSDAVAKEIARIAEKVLDQDDLPTLCFQVLDGSRASTAVDAKLKEACYATMASRAQMDSARAELLRKIDVSKLLGRVLKSDSGAKPDDALSQLLELIGVPTGPAIANIPKSDSHKKNDLIPNNTGPEKLPS
jgi:hypothetical protein